MVARTILLFLLLAVVPASFGKKLRHRARRKNDDVIKVGENFESLLLEPFDEQSEQETNEFWGRELHFSFEPSVGDHGSLRFELFLESFLALNPNLDEERIRDTNTPQWRALTWLADEDGMPLDPTSTNALQRLIALQRFILAAFYFSTEGINWARQYRFLEPISVCEWNNGNGGDFCLLQGVGCNAAGLVTTLRIESNNVVGPVPPELFLLTDLKEINLGNNYIAGGDDFNSVFGTLPGYIGELSALTLLDFGGNDLSGTIPNTIGDLTSLTRLDFNANSHLSGSIPCTIGNLAQLTHLDLGDIRSLSGTIPKALSFLLDLNYLDLRTNRLEGTVPNELGALTKLTYLSIRENYDLAGNLEFLCTNDFDWTYFASNCEPGFTDPPTICPCCTVCYC